MGRSHLICTYVREAVDSRLALIYQSHELHFSGWHPAVRGWIWAQQLILNFRSFWFLKMPIRPFGLKKHSGLTPKWVWWMSKWCAGENLRYGRKMQWVTECNLFCSWTRPVSKIFLQQQSPYGGKLLNRA